LPYSSQKPRSHRPVIAAGFNGAQLLNLHE
jgi:hypothetical protein